MEGNMNAKIEDDIVSRFESLVVKLIIFIAGMLCGYFWAWESLGGHIG